MLTDEMIEKFELLRDDEDNSLWEQGDLLRDTPLSKAEMKKLAEMLQRKSSTLELRRRVSTETPSDKRHKDYSWSIYAIFVKIEDPTIRWQLMFSRRDWTIPSANAAVRDTLYGPQQKKGEGTSKAMVVGDVLVKGRIEKGVLTLKVWNGEDYDVDYQQNDKFTTITLSP